MIKNLVQTTLDNALFDEGIYSYEQNKSGPDADEYIVYSSSGDNQEDFADDEELVKSADITLRYYYRAERLDNYTKKQEVRTIENLIESSMKAAGFNLPFGKFDAGDVDDIGYMVTVFEFEYWRVI